MPPRVLTAAVSEETKPRVRELVPLISEKRGLGGVGVGFDELDANGDGVVDRREWDAKIGPNGVVGGSRKSDVLMERLQGRFNGLYR